ncbi:protein mono-ADP-ribosyltransferase PARP14-like [Micropterus dolomieu]|uniref:protein mono-ADP-ribosyltransferase PARP14-like n=1 Tax=Micropterus dolomieu TaxID=147949 RepID=UPI001E8E8DD5|nr:protein mono-ADP-ribosyltransferase PARP14-like [Micropterus dolomieu]
MADTGCPPLIVEGDWSPAQNKTMKNKLQLYFQSKKKSGGGDCRVEAEDGAPRAEVYFISEEVREQVLARTNHEIVLENQTVKLRLISASAGLSRLEDPNAGRKAKESLKDSDDASDSKTKTKSEVKPGGGASAESKEDKDTKVEKVTSVQSVAVVLENVDSMSRDLLSMLVENISGLEDSAYSLEIIWETNRAVITFNSPADVEKFLTVSQSSQKLQKYGLTARPLEAAKSVRVESLPPTVTKDVLELYSEKSWSLPDNIVMIPSEQAAIVAFNDPKVVESICTKDNYVICSTTVKVYPYYESLGTALYGKERPTWKLPEPFTEGVHPAVWKFLQMKKQLKIINDQMSLHFCSVDLDNPEVKLSPLPSFLRQKGLTAKHVDMWMSTAQEAFRQQMSQYTAFECPVDTPAWKAAEKDVRSVIRDDAFLVMDASRGVLVVAGRADDIKQFRAPVENIVLKAMSQIKRQTDGVSDGMDLSPAMFYILQQEGLQKAALNISPDMNLSYNRGTQKLTITGLPAEVFQTKAWILQRNMGMCKKPMNVPPCLLDFLKTVDPTEMSQDLFTSQGISAIYSIEDKGVMLLGSSENALADAESKMKTVFLRAGDAIVTGACNLPCKYVVHAVGPRFSDYDKKTSVSRLKLAVKESLSQAEKVHCSTIALPAISSGVFGFPVDLCADTIAQAVREYCDSPGSLRSLTEIHLVDNNDNTVRVLAAAVNREFGDLGPTMTVPQWAEGKGTGASGRYQWGRGRGQNQSPRGQQFAERGRGGGREREAGGTGAGSRGGWQSNSGGQSSRGHTRPGEHGGPGRMEQTTAGGLKIALCKGNIQDQKTFVIVNTISENMDLNQGAVSKAILEAAGSGLQSAVRSEARVATLQRTDVVITDGFKLRCRKVFHAVCPFWDNGRGQAEEELITTVRYCLDAAEKRQMTSLSFPAIGTGNLGFPRDLVSRVLLREIHSFSQNKKPRHLREVVIVVHPSDSQTVDCFTRAFRGQTDQRNMREAQEFNEAPVASVSQSQQPSASFSRVSSPSLGVHRMQMGQLTLEVSSGDITKEASDVIINSSSPDFTLKAGVSKAILDSAGLKVEMECAQIVNSPGYQPRPMILTSAGKLPSKNIIHIVGQRDPAQIKDMVYSVLKVCEENKFKSVSFPALGTGQAGAKPSAVADAMVGAVVEFVRKKQPKFVRSVKFLIFQTFMVTEFHKSMMKREGEGVEEKNVFTKIRDSVTTFVSTVFGTERRSTDDLDLEREEFEPTVFQLCADNEKALSLAKKRIQEVIVAEQAERTITDQYISQLSQADMDQLKALQRELTVSIRLDKGQEDQEPKIHLEGLTRDVFTAEATVRDIIRKVERTETLRNKALLVSGLVEWQFQHHNKATVPFDIYTNLNLEEALEKKQSVKIKILNENYNADAVLRKAVSENGRKMVELLRKDLKGTDAALPPHWDDMKGDLLKLFPLTTGSQEYNDVETEVKKTGLAANIISIKRVQNTTLWQSYQLLKKHLEVKNNHTNNERRLFHGTGANSIDLINNQGFNRSYAGTQVGAAYGNGSYFAVDPGYSANGYATPDAKGHKRMYLARVLVGDFTQGRRGMITPPAKSYRTSAELYDSVVDQTPNPTMFVIFNDIQAYPEYLITFT